MRRNYYSSGHGGLDTANLLLTDHRRLKNVVMETAERLMLGAAQIVLRYTIPNTPIDTGALRRSGRAITRRTSSGGVGGLVIFGNEEVDYASRVHEDLSMPHRVGSAKYLEIGGLQAQNEVDQYIIEGLKAASIE